MKIVKIREKKKEEERMREKESPSFEDMYEKHEKM